MSSEARVSQIVTVVAAGAIASLAAFWQFGAAPSIFDWEAAAFFATFGFLGYALAFQTSQATSGSIGFLPWLTVAIVSPTVAAPISVFVSAFAGDALQRKPLIKTLFNASQHSLAVSAGLAAFVFFGGAPMAAGTPRIVAFVALVLVYFVLNKLAVSTVVSAVTGGQTWSHWLRSIRGSIANDVLSAPLVLFFAVVYSRLGAGWAALFALPMFGIREMYRIVFAMKKVNEELLQLMVASIEARDPYTSGHSQRVARYSRVICRLTGLSGKAAERVEIAALLHDVGKIHEEFAAILRKPGKLTKEEFEVMKTHPARSADLVARVSQFQDLVPSILAHHESWDGTGYPARLSQTAIPLGARVITLADTIDAMTTDRPYRRALTNAEVREELQKESGRQFDPALCSRILGSKAWDELAKEIALAQVENPPLPLSDDALEGRTGEFRQRTSADFAGSAR